MITKNTCTGCGACAASCPHKCIQMRQDKLGQIHPVINKKICVSCGLCESTCPQNYTPSLTYPQDCYVAWSCNSEDWVRSASGGVGITFARWCMKNGYCVYCCDYDAEGNLRHFRLRGDGDLSRARGSKYSHSDIGECYKEIRDLLKKNIDVMFTGTPCQVAGLRNYLNKGYDHLVTVDLVCHGTPPNVYLRQHLEEQGVCFPVDKISFRGEYDQKLTVWKDKQIIYQADWKNDRYFSAFYGNMISYDSCYSCQYAQGKRVADITIGDFWGLGFLNEIDRKSNRPSLVLTNTPKGRCFFEKIKSELIWEKRSVEEGIQGNGRLLKSPGKNIDARIFQRIYQTHLTGFRGAVRGCHGVKRILNRVNKLKHRLGLKGEEYK